MMDRVIRVKNWQELKRLAINLKPDSVVYNIEQNGLSPERELTCLRLIMPTKEAYYIFLDFPKEEKLRETGIPIRRDKKGNRCLEDKDVVSFLKTQLERKDLTVCSYWTI
ncbi:hypothetical protein MUP59_03280 [Candidatus Bathyarchaeota archaeon]|nr:hypothetical protein [Candidatus Bathyarchaeota archaeon]